jgi:SET domain-containing protein
MRAYIGQVAGKGRGVIARERISCGEVVECSPVIVFPKEEWEQIGLTVLGVYCYFWGESYEDGAFALGLGSLYNHSFQPNAKYIRHTEEQMMEYVAIRDIEAGEEITINYNGDPEDMSPVWFDVI